MTTAPRMTLGVEEELLVVDAAGGHLVPRAQEVLAVVDAGEVGHVTGEMHACQVELNTAVCTEAAEVLEQVAVLRRRIADAAATLGCAVLPTATHPWSSWRGQQVRRQVRRYARMEERFRLLAQEQVICGMHVHLGAGDRDLHVALMGRLTPWLPVLLALSANSPGWEGADSGYASFRTEVFRRWPTATFPPDLPDAAAFDAVVADLVAADAVQDASSIYWYLRPSCLHPTVESRICDVPLLADDTAVIAALHRGLAWALASDDRAACPTSPHLLDTALWRAARYGLTGDLLHPRTGRIAPAADVVQALLDAARPGLAHHGDLAVVERGLASLLGRGTGSEVQRRTLGRLAEPAPAVAALRRIGGTGAPPTGSPAPADLRVVHDVSAPATDLAGPARPV